MKTIVIQPKPALIDNDTDCKLCNVFIEILQNIRREHDAIVERFGMFNEEKFYSTNKHLDSITPSLITANYK